MGYTNGASVAAPHGTIDFVETSKDNRVLGSAILTGDTVAPAYINSSNPVTGKAPDSIAIGDFNGDGIPDTAVANNGASTVTILPGKGDGTFAKGSTITVNSELVANAVVTADFNGDGKADLAVLSECGTGSCASTGALAILLGNGDGTFASSDTIAVTSERASNPLAVADFNGDGIADIAVASASTSSVTVLLGKGDGTFSKAAGSPVNAGPAPFAIAAGDFNGDGIPDLAVANHGVSGKVTVLLGNGDGSFTEAHGGPIAVGYGPSWIAVGDFDGDGKLDMAVVNAGTDSGFHFTRGTLEILLGNGDGTFRKAPKTPTTFVDTEWSVAIADFNGDGIPDLGVAGVNAAYTLTLLSGKGDGTFTNLGHPLVLGASNTGIGVADFNGDGLSGFAVTNNRDNTVGILLPEFTAKSTATAPSISPVGFNRQQVAGSFAATKAYASSTSAAITLSAPLAPSETTLTMSSSGKTIASGSSLPWGGVVDLIAKIVAEGKTQTSGMVSFCDAKAATCSDIHLHGTAAITPAGTATWRFHPGMGSHEYKAIFNGTPNGKHQDEESSSNTVKLTITGHYPTVTTIAQTGNASSYTLTATVAGLVDVPGLPSPAGTVSFLDSTAGNQTIATAELGNGVQGLSFLASQTPSAGSFPYAIVSGDFNGDGIPDLAVGNDNFPEAISILLGNDDGTFRQARGSPFNAPGGVVSLVAGDFNGDGILDLAGITGSYYGELFILMGKGDGTFKPAKYSPVKVGGAFNILNSLAVGDLNRDGIEDLVVLAGTEYPKMPAGVYVLLGNGAGQFSYSSDSPLPVSTSPFAAAIADFNGDGVPDLAITNLGKNSVSILLGKGDGRFARAMSSPIHVGVRPEAILAGDFNGDGKVDLAVANANSRGSTGSVSVLLGHGDGTFKQAAHSPITVGDTPVAIVAGDFNQDGKPDLAVANNGSDTMTVLLGNGDGTFRKPASSPLLEVGQFPQSMASADFNGDGVPDIAVASWGNGPAYLYFAHPTQTTTATATGVGRPSSGEHLVEASFPAEGIFTGSASSTTPLFATQITAAVQVEVNSTITTSQSATVFVIVDGGAGNPFPTGSITLKYGTYSSGAYNLYGSSPNSMSSVTIAIPAGALPVGTGTLTAAYKPDSPSSGTYSTATGTHTISVVSSQ